MSEDKKASRAFAEADGGRGLTLQLLPMPADTIADNYISAGWLLSEMDKAGGWRAHDYTGGRVVTAGIDAISFKKPVFVGDLVSIYTEVVRQGRTSMTMKIESWARRRESGNVEKVTEGLFTFVHIDEKHRPIEIERHLKSPPSVTPPRRAMPSSQGALQDMHKSAPVVPGLRDRNYLGDIFGGWILEQMDLACKKEAEDYTGRTAVSVGVDAMSFYKPVVAGDEINFYTEVVKTGDTSIAIRVEAWAKRQDGNNEKVTEGTFTYVAIDKDRKPVPVMPKL